ECTINGLGERAGNTALEEIVMALRVRNDHFKADTGIVTEHIYRTSRLVSALTGIAVQPNKAIVGENAFAHESGIHQDGVLKERSTYEIMTPESIGVPQSRLVLGKHSGRHAFRERLRELGYNLDAAEIEKAYQRFIEPDFPDGPLQPVSAHGVREDANVARACALSAPPRFGAAAVLVVGLFVLPRLLEEHVRLHVEQTMRELLQPLVGEEIENLNPSLIEKALQRTVHVDKQDFVVAPTLIVLGGKLLVRLNVQEGEIQIHP